MIRIRMLETADGATDGAVVRTYEQGETYEVSEDLAECFEASGQAELVADEDPPSDAEEAKPKGKSK